jgi:hypothetical protein
LSICSRLTAAIPRRIPAEQPISSDLTLNELRFGLNYQFGGDPALGNPILTKAPTAPDPDNVNFHGQFTLVEQATPHSGRPIRGPVACLVVARAARQRT